MNHRNRDTMQKTAVGMMWGTGLVALALYSASSQLVLAVGVPTGLVWLIWAVWPLRHDVRGDA